MKKYIFVFLFLFSLALLSMKNTGYQVGDTAIDFKLKNVNDKKVSLKDYKKAKGFIVIFTCNHCPFSVANEDRIIALHKKYESQGYPVVAINPNDVTAYPDDSFENMKVRAKEKGFTFAYLYDETQAIAKTYGATKTPHIFVLDKKLTVKYIGAIDDAAKDESKVSEKFLENALDALIAGKNIEKTSTKAVGCGIKWKK
ncbi:MAG: thioredoxin family protein [Cytophagia bacterium]|nr:MAG: thioredoxin family protein [Cytophagia bacterium]TAG46341.1 MAG: thioredoxin family protein [Cytophagia bacterium]TAH30586.1 MAG: thioredoxin family protein [Cytophagales bacterium]